MVVSYLNKTIKMHYGEKEISIELPNKQILAIVDPNTVSGVPNEEMEIKRTLENPISNKGLSSLTKRGGEVMILCDDYTRPTPVAKIMPILLDKLNAVGFKNKHIKVMIASGTHRLMTDEEIRKKVGEKIMEKIEVMNHYWTNQKSLVDLGKTSFGVSISVNKDVVDADVVIGVGSIFPHANAGYSGGAKIIQPGVCGAVTTGQTHWLSAKFSGEEILGVVENPVRLEIEEVARKVGLDFIINTILNSKGEIVKVVAGDFVKAHREGVKVSSSVYRVEIPSKAEIVISDSYPGDVDLWQSVKGIYASELAVKKGGTIVLIVACPEGVSGEHPEVLKYGYRPYHEVEQLIKRGKITDLVAASDIAHVGNILSRGKIILYSGGISKEETKKLNFVPAGTPQDAVDKALAIHGSDSKIIVLRNSAELLPCVRA